MKAAQAMTAQAAMHDLMGIVCPCGAAKDRRRAFCLPCFQRLPRALRRQLAGAGRSEFLSSDYPATYGAALAALEVESPFLKRAA